MSTRDRGAGGSPPPRSSRTATAKPTGASWGAVADAVGHCMLVFAFAPTLAVLPRWILFEATNPLNLQEPVVLAFLPVRAGLALVNAFFDGVTQGVFAGVVVGILLSGWYVRRGVAATTGGRILLGAACGALGAAIMVATMLSLDVLQSGTLTAPIAPVLFELVSGTVCGALAIPHAVRLLAGDEQGVPGELGASAAP